jgi:hypothetical protein
MSFIRVKCGREYALITKELPHSPSAVPSQHPDGDGYCTRTSAGKSSDGEDPPCPCQTRITSVEHSQYKTFQATQVRDDFVVRSTLRTLLCVARTRGGGFGRLDPGEETGFVGDEGAFAGVDPFGLRPGYWLWNII